MLPSDSAPTGPLGPAAARLVAGDLLVANTWAAGRGEAQETVNPADEQPLWRINSATPAQVDAAVAAARAAFDGGEWSRCGPTGRRDLLLALADQMERHRAELEEIVVADVGTPVSLARTLQVAIPIANLRWFADAAVRGPRGGYDEPLRPHFGNVASTSMLLREPVGVVAALVAYNYPLYLTVWKIGAALAAGCPVVLMPSPRAPLAVAALAELAVRAGFPPGAVNLVQGPPSVGEQLARHPDVDMVSFTGSETAGAAVMRAAADTTKKVVLELGGKSPDIVLPGVDPDQILPAAVLRFTRNAGQGCGATTRLLVPRQRYDEFAAAAIAALESLRVGDPTDPATDVGPLISAGHRAGVLARIGRATAAGGRVLCGGQAPPGPGYYLRPTLVGGLSNSDELAQEELFAPVGVILPYEDVTDAVRLANESRFGLNANIWGPTTEAFPIARRLRVGNVTLNGGGDVRPESPWGGYKRSGVGREMGEDGLAEYFHVKHLQWRM
ncbi:aldehyde dehydrogenase family protein [Polymorphospora lycopeni]|uniref:Aldehyde dehydrogenase family protein n=1 Tax=Polymorphospora lycopeni TaxID=3140240 RepID=A0ABV5CMN6_9ACTN